MADIVTPEQAQAARERMTQIASLPMRIAALEARILQLEADNRALRTA
jgi:hypothetical protein